VVRFQALESLQALAPGSNSAFRKMIAMLEDPDFQVQQAAIRALGTVGPQAADAVPFLIRDLEREGMRDIATETLGKIGPAARDAVASLMEGLQAPEQHIQSLSAEALGGIGDAARPAIPDLIQMLQQGNVWDRISAAKGLGGIGIRSEATLAALNQAMGDDYPEVQRAARSAKDALALSDMVRK